LTIFDWVIRQILTDLKLACHYHDGGYVRRATGRLESSTELTNPPRWRPRRVAAPSRRHPHWYHHIPGRALEGRGIGAV